RGGLARAGQARRPRSRLSRRLALPAVGRPRRRRRPRRLARPRPDDRGRRQGTLRTRNLSMARAAAKRNQRAKKAAGTERQPSGSRANASSARVEQTLFFNRLRRNEKWVFVFLALVFSISFVIAGVGSGSTGIGDLFNGNLGG